MKCACGESSSYGTHDEHNHEHEHEHEHNHNDEHACHSCELGHGHSHSDLSLKTQIILLSLSVVIAICGFYIQHYLKDSSYSVFAVFIFACAYLLAGWDVLLNAAKNIARGQVFDELFLMSTASIGAFFINAMEEAIGVMVLYKIGELLQEAASSKSRSSIRSLLALRPDKAYKQSITDGITSWLEINPEEISVGDIVLVKPGERVPVDGIILEGSASVDTSMLTGENAPRFVSVGQELLSGSIVLDAVVIIKALRKMSESSAARIIQLVEEAAKSKAKVERFITSFAKRYTPIVVIGAVGLALIAPFFMQGQSWVANFKLSSYRALILLVISCPCAFVISVPLAYFAGLGGLAKRGILCKGSSVLDALAKAKTAVFDKTGTLSDGSFRVLDIKPENGFTESSILEAAVAAETYSNHPIAIALRNEWSLNNSLMPACDKNSYTEISGHGITAIWEGKEILVGADRLLHLKNVEHTCQDATGTELHIAVAGKYAGHIILGDRLRPDGAAAIKKLKGLGLNRIAIFTGDSEAAAASLAKEAGISEVHHSLLPKDKLTKLESIITDTKNNGTVIFIGDGINDAPSLARSDVGISMQGSTDAAVENADVIIMSTELSRIPEAISRARKIRSIAAQNIAFALIVKVTFMAFGAFGLTSMWEAVIADAGVALIAVLSSLRAAK